jgi:hypothetical protein
VSEQPDSSLLQVQVCDPMAEKLQGLNGSALQHCGEPHMAQGCFGVIPDPESQG